MRLPLLKLKKNEDRRLRLGHVWIYSNEIDVNATPLKTFTPGQEVIVEAHDKTQLGIAYVNPNSLIAARLLTRNMAIPVDLDFFIHKIQAALSLRERLYEKPYYRLVFGESDGLPGLIIDRFENHFVSQINTAGMELKKDWIIMALRHVFPTLQSILFKNDTPSRLQEGLTLDVYAGFGHPPEKIQLEENGVLFHAPSSQGQKTGWFYDHRLNRSRLSTYVQDQTVLDVFSYLGAWGIQAATNGAKQVICIDSSPLSKTWISENAALNNVSDKVQVITEDAFVALKNLQQLKEKFGVIILDPPAFAKKQKDKKEGFLAYQRINELAMKLLAPQGILISCSCSMHIDQDEFLQALCRAIQRSHSEFQLLERGHQAPDHPVHPFIHETDYLKMMILWKGIK